MNLTVLTVKQVNTYVRSLLEGDVNLASVCISGEMSNIKIYSSGHLYFSLRESECLIKGVMFASNVARLNFIPKDGMKVIAKGKITLYEKDGTYQLMCESIIQDGEGDVSLKYKLIKDKLEKEGLFDSKFKKPIPTLPNKIAAVTSRDGAALQDIINVLSRRYPLCELVVYPTLVQGATAPSSIINALNLADKSGADIIIVGRGGGSKEDLEAFNDEELARTVFKLDIPCISAVGHETDYTIIDYVSDLRAPTPSAAAEIAVPNVLDIYSTFEAYEIKIKQLMSEYISDLSDKIDVISQKEVYTNPNKLYNLFDEKIDISSKLLSKAFEKFLSEKENNLNVSAARLNDLNPLNILSRGYSLVYKNDLLLKNAFDINDNDELTIRTENNKVSFKAIEVKKGE